ncbi:MAG: amidohydrolase family protein [Chitinophagaceae bacterium]|nr:amidohydrolase family protein [Chitinophagaceae bacterium]
MPIEQFIPLLTSNPASFLKINNKKGEIKTGHHADFVIWAPEEKFVVKEADVLHRHTINPYNGLELFGAVKQTIVNGETVYKNKMVDKNKKYGKIILATETDL